MMELNIWNWSRNLILVSEKHSPSVGYRLFTFAGSIPSHYCYFTVLFFLEKYWRRRIVEESGAALIYGSAFATQLVLSVLCF